MSRILTLNVPVTEEEFASLIARFADRAILSTSDGTASLSIPSNDEDDDDNTVSNVATGLDSAGVPWIEGVHSSSKKQNADGTWRLMKGVDKDKAAAAIAAAKQTPSAPPVAPPVAPVYEAPTAQFVPPVTEAPAVVATPVGLPAGLPGMPPVAAPAPIPAPVIDVPVSYQDVINKATELASKGVDTATFTGVYARAGVTDTNALVNDETLRRTLMKELNAVTVA